MRQDHRPNRRGALHISRVANALADERIEERAFSRPRAADSSNNQHAIQIDLQILQPRRNPRPQRLGPIDGQRLLLHLASIAEARALARRAKEAWSRLAELNQEQIDAIVDGIAEAATAHARDFADLAVEETGYGVVEDKVQKNLFSSQKVYGFIRPMKTVGVIARHEETRVLEIAEPFGVVAAVKRCSSAASAASYFSFAAFCLRYS